MDREVFQQQFGLLGSSDALRQVVDKIMQVAKTDITVLLQGESGVGKDVTARAIHGMSHRKHNELIIVNCGAIPEGIIESELFGHEKGAFTGANDTRQGYFEKADGGTIFLDEISLVASLSFSTSFFNFSISCLAASNITLTCMFSSNSFCCFSVSSASASNKKNCSLSTGT